MTRPYYISSIALIFIVPALGGLLFGYDIGATSFAIVQLGNEQLSGLDSPVTSPVLTGLFVAAPSAGALVGSLFVFCIADVIGRRKELQYGSLLYIAGALLESFQGGGMAVILLGRFVYGLGIGFSMHGAPTYLGEMLPSSIRGALMSLKEVCIVLGILLGYMIGYASSNTVRGWAFTYSMSLLGSISMFILSFTIPYSARWLVLKDRPSDALVAIRFIYHPSVADQEHAYLVDAISAQTSQMDHKGIFHPSRRPALTAGIGLVALQQVTGQPSVLSYATPMFVSVGLSSYSSVLVALFKLVATSLAVITVEHYGRKQLLYLGCSLMLVALVALSVTFAGTTDALDDNTAKGLTVHSTCILVAMFVYIGGYQVCEICVSVGFQF